MTFKKVNLYSGLFSLLISATYTWYLFRSMLMKPGASMICHWDDAAKNYYTFLYHTLYGKGFTFDGMNYPFHEHVSFTDNQPLIAVPLSYLRNSLHLEFHDFLTVMNLMTPVFFFLSSYTLYRLLKLLGVQAFLAAIFGLLIVAMPPNICRIFGHFGLSYTFNIILCLYFLFQYKITHKYTYLVYITLLNFFIAFIHIYNLACGFFLTLFFSIACIFFEDKNWKNNCRKYLPLMASAFLSFAMVKMVFLFTDPITDRPTQPWGILNYTSKLHDYFTSYLSHLGKAFVLFFGMTEPNPDYSEGYAYLGFIPALFVVFVFINFLLSFFKQKLNNAYTVHTEYEKTAIITSVFCMILAMGIPFVWNMEFLLDYVSVFKQFRSLGRFSLLVYFLLGIATVIRIDLICKSFWETKKINLSIFFLLFVLLIWSIDIFSYSKMIQKRTDDCQSNYLTFFDNKMNPIDITMQHDYADYQCILGLPFYCIGSEKVGKVPISSFMSDLFRMSLCTKLPIVNTQLSRSSWSQSFQLMRLIGGPFTDKEMFSNAINTKPILLMYKDEGIDNLSVNEKHIIEHAVMIKKEKDVIYYSLNWQAFIASEKAYVDSLNKQAMTSLTMDSSILINHFNEGENVRPLWGKGALNMSTKDSAILYEGALKSPAGIHEFSTWVSVNQKDYRMPGCDFYFYDANHQFIRSDYVGATTSTDNIGFWFRMSSEIKTDSSMKYMRIVLRNDKRISCYAADEFQFSPIQYHTFFANKEDTERLYDNHIVQKK